MLLRISFVAKNGLQIVQFHWFQKCVRKIGLFQWWCVVKHHTDKYTITLVCDVAGQEWETCTVGEVRCHNPGTLNRSRCNIKYLIGCVPLVWYPFYQHLQVSFQTPSKEFFPLQTWHGWVDGPGLVQSTAGNRQFWYGLFFMSYCTPQRLYLYTVQRAKCNMNVITSTAVNVG